MYRNQFRSDRFNDNATATRRPGRGSGSGTHHWVVSGGRGTTAPAARPPSSPYRSGRPGNAQQQYRPRSPATVLTQGNANSHTPAESSAPPPGHTELMSKAFSGSLDDVKSSNVPAQSDALSSVSDERTCWAADSSTPTIPTKGYSSTAFTLQFGTFSPEAIDKQCTTCTSSALTDLNRMKHEKVHHGLSDKPNNISSSPDKEQRKHEATDELVIGGRNDLTDKNDNVLVPELHETRLLELLTSPSKACMEPCEVLPKTPSSPTHQQCQNQVESKDAVNARRSDTAYKYPDAKPTITVQIPASYAPNMAPSSFMHPVPGRPLPVAFQQKQTQVPVEFRGPGLQMQTVGSVASSLPVKMALSLSNASHMQPLFVHGAQPRALHQQTFIQQGQGFGCAPPANGHLPQFGNMRMAQELSQQQSRSGDENKRIIKITHPETHEELMLDRRGHSFIGIPASGQMPLHNTNHVHQPVQTLPPLQKVYYPRPGTYNSAPIYLPNTNSVPLSTRQLSSKMQPTMHSFDSPNSSLTITSIKPPIPSPWLAGSSTPMTSLHSTSEFSNFKGLLRPSLSAPVQVELKPPIAFPAEKNEVSSETSKWISGEETHRSRYSSAYSGSSQQSDCKIGLEISPQQEKLVSESNPKVHTTTSDASYNSMPQAVSTQQAQAAQPSQGHVIQIEGPQNIPTNSNLPLASTARYKPSVNAKSIEIGESSVISTTSSSRAKCESSHKSFVSTTDGTSPADRNSKYDSSSILGRPPLICTQEMLRPKSAGCSTFIEVNTFPCLEKKSEVNGSVPQQNQDFMIEEHVDNDEAMCFKSKTDVTTPGAFCGLEDDTGVATFVKAHAHHESVDSSPSISIDDLQTSSENKKPPSDAQNTIESTTHVINVAIVSNSVSTQEKPGQENTDSEILNPSYTVSASVVQTKRFVLESRKAKSICGQTKRQKEILPKTTGQRYSDLDCASSSLNEIETFNTSEDVQSCTADAKNCTLHAEKEISTVGNDSSSRTDLIGWEDGIDNSNEKLIFDKALMEPTFCEMYASFCFRLAGDLPNFVKDDEKITFKGLLLNKCQEEFETGEREQAEAEESEGGMKQSEGVREDKRIRARRRMLGNIRLIGELYKKKMLTERIMHECIHKLLGEYHNPDEEDLESLCKLMSTIGEMIDHPRAKVHMDFYFDLMRKLSENFKLSSRMKFMLEDVIDLRKNRWRQRRKVEGPKKIEEVRRDAVKQKLGQSGSAKDEKEVALCMKELNAPSFYPSLVSLWINDSFERTDLKRELLAKLLVDLCKSQENLLNQKQLLQGFQYVLSTLEDAVTDAPKATEFLGRMFAKFILEDVISLTEIGGLLQERNGKEEPAGHHPVNDTLASEVLRSMLQSIEVVRGDSAVDEIHENPKLQHFRRPGVCF
ncbi:hypothetical protein PR202_gb14809 [Eleusine coracana subsp. coracana]|uniref:Eukaryotic translation initiation factor 4G n=1 Tax=Eleusine coracana subsp. coracana TaxID=191504 RepID=A0AAV5ETX4_ELECO|nr:hypothetical protein PR202_gb14809 [Eleusine coracana subsp. coracana]